MSPSSPLALRTIQQWQSETDAIRHAPEPIGARIAVAVLSLVLVGMIALTPLVTVDRVVSSDRGKIVSTHPLTIFQALDPSIIRSIDVKEGQQVREGQILATLDPTFAQADVGQLRQQLAGLDAQIARGQAEQSGAPLVVAPDLSADERPYMALQKALFDQRALQFAAQSKSLDEKIKTTLATIDKLQGDDVRFEAREKIAHQVEDMRNTLYRTGSSSLVSLLEATDGRLEVLRSLDNGHNSLIEAQHQLSSLQADKEAFIQQWNATISQDLVSAENQRDLARSSLEKASRHQELIRLTAPDDAVVLSVSKVSAGSVLKIGDQVISLAPLNSPVEAEIDLPARDIGFVRPGDPVSLKIDAFSFFEHGEAHGRLSWISEGAFTAGDDGQEVAPFYKARVHIDPVHLTDVPSTFRLVPGMSLVADVRVGSRSVFKYIMGGFVRGMGEPMRDP